MTGHIGRREFITLLGGAAAWPLAARAQQPAKLPIVGFLVGASRSATSQWIGAFVQRLRELGWTEGRTVTMEFRWADGKTNARPRSRQSSSASRWTSWSRGERRQSWRQNTRSIIPIVFAAAGDPVASNLVASLAQPGGNVTGLSLQQTDLAAKRLELLRELVPNLGRLAIMANVGSPGAMLEMGEAKAPARTLGWAVDTFEIRRPEDIEVAFETLKGRAEALYVCGDPLLTTNRIRIITWAMSLRVPTIYNFREYVESGGLMSYGPNLPDLYRRAGDYVDKILRGTKPGDIPVEQPSKFDLIINLTTAKALGLMTPESFLLRADEVIE